MIKSMYSVYLGNNVRGVIITPLKYDPNFNETDFQLEKEVYL